MMEGLLNEDVYCWVALEDLLSFDLGDEFFWNVEGCILHLYYICSSCCYRKARADEHGFY